MENLIQYLKWRIWFRQTSLDCLYFFMAEANWAGELWVCGVNNASNEASQILFTSLIWIFHKCTKTADWNDWSRPSVKTPRICKARHKLNQACRFIYWLAALVCGWRRKLKAWERIMGGGALCPWRKCNVQYKECGNKTRNEKRGLKVSRQFPAGPIEHSPLPMIINPDLGSAVYVTLRLQPLDDSSLSASSFLSIFCTLYAAPVGWRKHNLHISEGEGRGAARRPSHRQLKGCWSLVSYRRQSQATPCELKEK